MSTKQISSEVYIPTMAKNTTTRLVIHSKERRQWRHVTLDGIIFSESYQEDVQTAHGIVVSDTQAKCLHYLWTTFVKDSPSLPLG